ncbi:MAG: hypothetical protein KDK04_24290, partial [Candidatus Competibacteraceae bacterium]|nr:hypothetical protein [Candidatus Competibacteraceae bacterium]
MNFLWSRVVHLKIIITLIWGLLQKIIAPEVFYLFIRSILVHGTGFRFKKPLLVSHNYASSARRSRAKALTAAIEPIAA